MPHPTAAPRAVISRRTALLALPTAASVAALAGCRWGPEGETTDASSATPRPADSDQEIVVRAAGAVASTAAVVAATFEARPRLRDQLAGFTTLHEAHLLQLETSPNGETAKPRSWSGILTAERTLQDRLVELAATADSGQLARALASMAAGIAQLVALASNGADA